MLTKVSDLNDCCRRACYVYDVDEKICYLKDAELLIVDLVGTMEILLDAQAITTEHKAKFDLIAISIGRQASAMRKVSTKRLGSIEGSLASE